MLFMLLHRRVTYGEPPLCHDLCHPEAQGVWAAGESASMFVQQHHSYALQCLTSITGLL
jgi:hypothetical protein